MFVRENLSKRKDYAIDIFFQRLNEARQKLRRKIEKTKEQMRELQCTMDGWCQQLQITVL